MSMLAIIRDRGLARRLKDGKAPSVPLPVFAVGAPSPFLADDRSDTSQAGAY